MGCDWQLYVQGLFQDLNDRSSKRLCWVTLNGDGQYSRTGCGGNPVRSIFRKYVEAGGAKGCFGEEQPNISDCKANDATEAEYNCVEHYEFELEALNETYDADGEVILLPKKQRVDKEAVKNSSATRKKEKEYLNRDVVLKKRKDLSSKIEDTRKKFKERGLIGSHPEWECFHMSVSEYQGLCNALLEGEFTHSYYDSYRFLLEWTDLLDKQKFKDQSGVEWDSEQPPGYHRHHGTDVWQRLRLEEVREEIRETWKDIISDYQLALEVLPFICQKIGCDEEGVGHEILGFCGRASPLDLRFSVHCEEKHLEEFRKGNMKGAFEFDGSCSIM